MSYGARSNAQVLSGDVVGGTEQVWLGSVLEDWQDASGLLYRRNRYYNPEQGRFVSEDPIGLAGGLNLYGFAEGDPVNYSDPFGLCPMCAVAYGVFEVGSTIYDAGDLAVMGFNYLRGKVSGRELAVTAGGAVLGVVSFGGGYGAGARKLARRLPFADADRLTEINKTLDRIEAGTPKYTGKDGSIFQNRGNPLPSNSDPNYYSEWTVDTPGASNRGRRRIVQGKSGETYYTDDHYDNFIRVNPRRQ